MTRQSFPCILVMAVAATGCGWFGSKAEVPEDGDADMDDVPADDATDERQDAPADQADGREDPGLPDTEAEADLPDEETSPTRTNFAPLDTWGLVTLPNEPRWAPSFRDTDVTHDGNPSIRQEGYIDPTDLHYYNREINRN